MPGIQRSIPRLDIIYEKVEADSRFSIHYLRILRMVDAFVDVSTNMRDNAETAELAIRQVLTRLSENDGCGEPIDPTGDFASRAGSAEGVVKHSITALHEIVETLKTPAIADEHVEAMRGSSEAAIYAFQKLHDAMVDLRWAVMEHDANLEQPEDKVFEGVEDLIADLKSN